MHTDPSSLITLLYSIGTFFPYEPYTNQAQNVMELEQNRSLTAPLRSTIPFSSSHMLDLMFRPHVRWPTVLQSQYFIFIVTRSTGLRHFIFRNQWFPAAACSRGTRGCFRAWLPLSQLITTQNLPQLHASCAIACGYLSQLRNPIICILVTTLTTWVLYPYELGLASALFPLFISLVCTQPQRKMQRDCESSGLEITISLLSILMFTKQSPRQEQPNDFHFGVILRSEDLWNILGNVTVTT